MTIIKDFMTSWGISIVFASIWALPVIPRNLDSSYIEISYKKVVGNYAIGAGAGALQCIAGEGFFWQWG